MSSIKSVNRFALICLVALAAACAGSSAIWGDLSSGLILEYRMDPQSVLSYEVSGQSSENVEVMGQKMQVQTSSDMLFSALAKGVVQKVIDLSITIDSSSVSIMSPRGELKGDMKDVVGKTFSMQLSALGQEMNMTGTEGIEYGLGPAGKRSATASLEVIFPNMAGKPVKIGDTWATKDTIDESGGGMDVLITMDGISTLDGVAKVQGYDCARIVSTFTGTIKGKGKQGPMDLVTSGTMKGVDTTYFAYKEGILVHSKSQGTGESVTEATGPQNMTIPSTREMAVDIQLRKGPAPKAD